MNIIHIRKAVAVFLLFAMLLSVMPLSVFAEDPAPTGEPAETEEIVVAESTTVAETVLPDSSEATELPAEEVSTEAQEETSENTEEVPEIPDTPEEISEPTEAELPAEEAGTEAPAEAPALTTPQAAAAPVEEETAAPTEESDEASEGQDPTEAESDSSLMGIVAETITSIINSLRGATATLRIPYQIFGAGAAYGQSRSFTYQYPYNDPYGHSVTLEGMNTHYLNEKVAYCLEPHKLATALTVYSELADDSSRNVWMQNLSESQRQAIALAISYGASNSSTTSELRGYEVATQVVIWEILFGERSAVKPYSRSRSVLYTFMDELVGYNMTSAQISKDSFEVAYDFIATRMATNGTMPSFMSASFSTAPTYTLMYNASSHTYSVTLTDSNNVLSNYSFPSFSGITFTKSGNQLTITATESAVETFMKTGAFSVSAQGGYNVSGNLSVQAWGAGNDQILCQMGSAPSSYDAYFKLQPESASVSLKKTANASASVMECIKGNPLYTLAGAVYEIHEGSATGPLVETLTTDVNGNASSTKQYAIGTKLYAVETKAPSGYLLNSSPVALTVSSGSNVFKVQDEPTFDPNRLEIKKTGTSSEYIKGAVFEFRYYAQYWTTDTPQRVWYFHFDANGVVKIDEAHLASGYTSDPLFYPYGKDKGVLFPLGFVFVTEVAAAPGYVLPNGGTGQVGLFITPGGTKTPQNGQPVRAYWGDFSANPLDAAHSKGIYKMENDSDGTVITAVNRQQTRLEIVKTSTDGKVEGISFKVEKEVSGSWKELGTYKTDADGKINLADLDVGQKLRITETVPADYVCTSENPQTVTLKKGLNTVAELDEREKRYTAELNEVLRQYDEYKEQAKEFNEGEFGKARLDIRSDKEHNALNQFSDAYGEHFSRSTFFRSRSEIDGKLDDEINMPAVRECVYQQRKQAHQQQKNRNSHEQER